MSSISDIYDTNLVIDFYRPYVTGRFTDFDVHSDKIYPICSILDASCKDFKDLKDAFNHLLFLIKFKFRLIQKCR